MNLINKLVVKNLKLNKKRSMVTVVGIILSIALITCLSTLVSSFKLSLIEYEKVVQGDYHVICRNVDSKRYKELQQNRYIESSYYINNVGYAKLDDCQNEYKPYAFFIGTDKKNMEKLNLELIEGRLPEKEGEVVIPEHLKTNGGIVYKVGDKLKFEVGTRSDKSDNEVLWQNREFSRDEEITDASKKEYTVVGEVKRPNTSIEQYSAPGYTFITYATEKSENVNMYMRLTTKGLMERYKAVAGILEVDADVLKKVSEGDNDITEEEYAQFEEQIKNTSYDLNTFLMESEAIIPSGGTMMAIYMVAGLVAIVIIFTSVYCIKNSFAISTSEKIRQYGMLSGIGATKRQLRKTVFGEAKIFGIIGIPVGLLSGNLASFILIKVCNMLIAEDINIVMYFDPAIGANVLAILLSIVTIYFSALKSAKIAGKISPIAAIRNNNEIKSLAKEVKIPKYVKKIWGIGGIISYKNMKRNKGKYRTTVVSIAVCTVTFVVISYFTSMLTSIININHKGIDCNIEGYVDISDSEQFDINDVDKRLKTFTDVDKCRVYSEEQVIVSGMKYADEYKDAFSWISDPEWEDFFTVCVLDDESFEEYAGKVGAKNEKGAILYNYSMYTDGEGVKARQVMVEKYDVKKGDKFTIYNLAYKEYSESCFENEFEGKLEEQRNKFKLGDDIAIDIAAVTDEKYKGIDNNGEACVYISQTYYDKLKIKGEYINYGVYFAINTDNADELEKALCSDFVKNGEKIGISVNNVDENYRQESSLMLLISIFIYGLTAVISLIGVTNIINTLGTSVKLRSREFATLRSVGMTDKQFDRLIRLESLFTGVKSLTIGCIVGMVISYLMYRVEVSTGTVFSYKPPIVAAIACVIVVMVLIYAIIKTTLNKINSKNIIETIRNENL